MAIKRLAHSFAAILILAPSSQAFAGRSDCAPDTRRRARLVIENHTACPIAIYFGDRYAGSCESMMTLTLHTKTTGKLLATARSRCDTWGPVELELHAAKTTTWTIDYVPETDGASADAARLHRRRIARTVRSGEDLDHVLRRHQDEDGGDQGDADNLGRDLHLDADRFAANLLEHQEEKQPAIHDR